MTRAAVKMGCWHMLYHKAKTVVNFQLVSYLLFSEEKKTPLTVFSAVVTTIDLIIINIIVIIYIPKSIFTTQTP